MINYNIVGKIHYKYWRNIYRIVVEDIQKIEHSVNNYNRHVFYIHTEKLLKMYDYSHIYPYTYQYYVLRGECIDERYDGEEVIRCCLRSVSKSNMKYIPMKIKVIPLYGKYCSIII